MKRISVALIAFFCGLMMVFAAPPPVADKCTEKADACKKSCGHQEAQCRARGATPESCENRKKQCESDCDKELKTCQSKAGTQTPPKAPATPPAKP